MLVALNALSLKECYLVTSTENGALLKTPWLTLPKISPDSLPNPLKELFKVEISISIPLAGLEN
jgi:hypothetical protein